jgi:4-alpha-glucanotransferase
VRPDGFDAWNAPDALMHSLAIGAPPDQLNTAGQNWGLAGFSGVGLQAHGFAPYRAMLRAVMRSAGAIRLDHVLGLKRLYVIPDGMPATDGAYVRLPFEQMLSIAAEESAHNRCIVIGEDLGTVPAGFRAQLAQWGLWSYQVMLFERDAAGGFHPPGHYAEQAVATFATHDLPTFAGWVDSEDLRVKQALGLDPGETARARATALARLRRAVDTAPSQDQDLDFGAVAGFLAASQARMLVIGLDDVLGVRDQANVPGTIDQHPNWRRKLPVDLERIADDARLRAIGRIVADSAR